MALDNMFQQFKDMSELQAYASALNETILNLAKQIDTLKAENQKLKDQVKNNISIVPDDHRLVEAKPKFETDDEETICRTQLRMLRDISLERELTLEECRKYDVYAKSLQTIKNAPKTVIVQASKISDKELLSIAENGEE